MSAAIATSSATTFSIGWVALVSHVQVARSVLGEFAEDQVALLGSLP